MSRRLSQNNISRLTRRSSPRTPSTQPSTSPSSSHARVPRKTLSSRSQPDRPDKKTTVVVSGKRRNGKKSTRIRQKRQLSNPFATLLLYALRLSIMGIGISAIAGTVLTVIRPTQFPGANFHERGGFAVARRSMSFTQASASSLSLRRELLPLKAKLEALAAKYPKLQPGAFFVDLDSGDYVNVRGKQGFSAASTIKIPILIAFFQDVDAGKVRLDEMLTMKKELIGGGSGDLQYQQPGKQFSALEIARKMIVISDNTATNMIIERLGGIKALNQRFRDWGLNSTAIHNSLPDLEGTNTTSPRDLAHLLAMVNRGELVSLKSRDRLLGIMQETQNRNLLPQGLEKDATIAHKTGDIGSVLGDAGIVDMPSGKRYIASILVRRPHNDGNAKKLIQGISRTAYQHFKWYKARPAAKQEAKNRSNT